MAGFTTEAAVRLKCQVEDTVAGSSALVLESIDDAHARILAELDPGVDVVTPEENLVAGETLLAGSCLMASLASGEAVFDRRSDNLLATLDRIALDVGASSAAIDNHITEFSGDWFDFEADDLFYSIKGQTYGYAMILTALREDFAGIIAARDVANIYDQMLASFRAVAALDPLVVTNNELDDQFIPNHLAAQGFYLLRARTQLREITNILLK